MKSWTRMTLVLGLVLCTATAAMAQPGAARRGRGGQPGGGFQGGRGGLTLLSDENVRKDLGVTDDQVKRLEAFQTKSRDEMRQAFQGLRDLTPEQRTAKLQDLQKKSAEVTAAAEKEILLPKQIDRLKQISIQSRLNRGSTADALASDELAKELGITDAQKEALKKAQDEANIELQEKMTKLRAEARQKILSVLTPDQQAKLKTMSGETIQFSRGRGLGGPGGTGGERGGAGTRGAAGRPGGAPLRRPPQGD